MKEQDYELHYRLEKKFWYFTFKTNLVRKFIAQLGLSRQHPARILDVGCGTGANLQMLAEYGNGFGLDNSFSALYFCQKRQLRRLVAGNVVGELPFHDESFDIVCAFDTLEHLEDERACLEDIQRILKKGAYLILTVPAFQLLWGQHDLAAGHKRRYTKSELIKRVSSVGFTVERCTYFNWFAFFPVLLFRKLIRRVRNQKIDNDELHLDFDFKLPPLLTELFLPFISELEMLLLRHFDLPFGVSLICSCRKKGAIDA